MFRNLLSVACVMALVLGLAGTGDAGPVEGDHYWQFDKKDASNGALDVRGNDTVGARHLNVWNSGTVVGTGYVSIPNPDSGPFSDGTPAENSGCLYGTEATPIEIRRGSNYFGLKDKSWTLEGWFKSEFVPDGSDWAVIAGTRNDSAGNWPSGFSLFMNNNGFVALFAVDSSGSYSSVTLLSDDPLNDEEWHHFAITWEYVPSAAGTLQLYIDGQLNASGDGVGNSQGIWGGTGVGATFAVGFREAADHYNWEGWLDEFRMTYDILEPTEFLNYVEPTSTDAPIAEPAGLGLLGLALLGLRKRRN